MSRASASDGDEEVATRGGLTRRRLIAAGAVVAVGGWVAWQRWQPEGERADAPSGPVTRRTVHLDPASGDDGQAGSEAAPWRSLETALGRLGPGDTLLLAGAIVGDIFGVPIAAATVDAPITLAPWPGRPAPTFSGRLLLKGADHWHLRDLSFRWIDLGQGHDVHMVHLNNSRGVVIEGCDFSGSEGFAQLTLNGDCPEFTIADSAFHDSAPAEVSGHGPAQDHNLYVSCTGGGVIERCRFWQAPNGFNVKIGGPDRWHPTVNRVEMRYCTMVDAWRGNVGCVYRYEDIVIRNCIADGVSLGTDSPGATYNYEAASGSHRSSSAVVSDCVGWGASEGVVDQDSPGGRVADGGGNQHIDPGLGPAPRFEPTEPDAAHAGWTAEKG